ncbi:MAG: GTP pyrophosphokinase [Lachnospiraceae bacterium]
MVKLQNMEEQNSIYGEYDPYLQKVLDELTGKILEYCNRVKKEEGISLVEHFSARIKTDASMREKCVRKGLPVNAHSALKELTDSVGIRLISGFIDDVYRNVEEIRKLPGIRVVKEKDYIRHAKDNGYRSYHMIIAMKTPFPDVDGNNPGEYYAEIQLRTIAMDSWAALEHKLKYKKNISNTKLIVAELKRCADEMASTDMSMQTIRDLIYENEGKEFGLRSTEDYNEASSGRG